MSAPGETAPETVTASDKEARVAAAADFVDAIGRMVAAGRAAITRIVAAERERDDAIARVKVAEARASAAERDAAIARAENAEADLRAEHSHKIKVIAAFKLLGVQRMHAKAAWGDWRDCDQSEKAARYDAAEAAEQRVKAAEARLRALGVEP